MMPPDFSTRYQALLRRRNAAWLAVQRHRRGLAVGLVAIGLSLAATPLVLLVVEWQWFHAAAIGSTIAGLLVAVRGLRLRRPSPAAASITAADADHYREAARRIEAETEMYNGHLRRLLSHRRAALALGAAGVFIGVCVH